MFSIFGPALLRVTVGLTFAFLAYAHFQRREELASLGLWLWATFVLEAVVAFSLLFGYYTQIGALIGIVLAGIQLYYAKRAPRATPLCGGVYLLLLIICISLMLTGAGYPAFDIPL